ncbi:MAG: hypothetical protein RR853_08810 [Aurantimicrobium sp.]|uniref:hypothetical protein n=1 Tax=Aurantimicrobium sp. TaxID=1930784 RepID=UPI002FCC28B3
MTNENDPQPAPQELPQIQVNQGEIQQVALEQLATKLGQANLDLAQSQGLTQALSMQLQSAQQEIGRLRGLIPGMGEDGEELEEAPEFPDHKSKTSRPKAQR